MVALKQGEYGMTGVDVLDWHQLNQIKPDGYIVAHMLGITSRAKRRRMYFSMLKQALWARNDELAEFALKKYILFLCRKMELVNESDYWSKGKHSTLWSSEKEAEFTALQHRLLRFYRSLLQNSNMYKKLARERRVDYDSIAIFLPKTWRAVTQAVVSILLNHSHSNTTWKLPVDERLIDSAYTLLWDIYTDNTTRKAFRLPDKSYDFNFPRPEKEIVEMLRHTVNGMSLGQVVYFLKKYPQMPRDWLHIFRVEFVRKGGAIDLHGDPLKN